MVGFLRRRTGLGVYVAPRRGRGQVIGHQHNRPAIGHCQRAKDANTRRNTRNTWRRWEAENAELHRLQRVQSLMRFQVKSCGVPDAASYDEARRMDQGILAKREDKRMGDPRLHLKPLLGLFSELHVEKRETLTPFLTSSLNSHLWALTTSPASLYW